MLITWPLSRIQESHILEVVAVMMMAGEDGGNR